MSAETSTPTALTIVQEPGIFNGLSIEAAEAIKATFEPFKSQVTEWQEKVKTIKVSDASQTELMAEAGTARKAVAKIRIAIEHKRKELKEDSLKRGQAIDKVAGGFKTILQGIEDKLEHEETFAKREREAAINKLHGERFNILNGLGYTYTGNDLGSMQVDVFNGLVKIAEEEKVKREEVARMEAEQLEREKAADAERKAAEAAERERIAAENEALRKQNEELRLQAERDAKALATAQAEDLPSAPSKPICEPRVEAGVEVGPEQLINPTDRYCLENLLQKLKDINPLQPTGQEAAGIVEEVETILDEAKSIIRNYLDKFAE